MDGKPKYKLSHGDCSLVEFGIVDHVITDPPYMFAKMGSDWSASDAPCQTKKQAVPNLSSGMAFKHGQMQQARDWFRPHAIRYWDAMRKGGFCIVFSAPRLSPGFAFALSDAGFAVRDLLSWNHDSGHFKAGTLERFGTRTNRRVPMPRPMFETIILAQKIAPVDKLTTIWKETGLGLIEAVPTPEAAFYVPKPSVNERTLADRHPTLKPVELIKRLLHTYTSQGDTVLDPFMGSGTTGVAAVQMGRDFIGIERDTKYFRVAERRIDEVSAGRPSHA